MSARHRLLAILAVTLACETPSAPEQRVPASPVGVLTSARTEEITVSWHDVEGETSFRIEVRNGEGPWLLLKETAPNITSVTHPGVLFGETYYYRVAACNAAGCSPWVETSGKWQTGGPPVITNVSVFSVTATSARFDVRGLTGGLTTTVVFSLRIKGGLTPVFQSEPMTALEIGPVGEYGRSFSSSIQHFALEPDTDYELTVFAQNAVGQALTEAPKPFKTAPAPQP